MGQSFDDIFGKKSTSPGPGGAYIKWEQVGDTVALVVRGAIVPDHPQKVFRTDKNKWVVKKEENSEWAQVAEGTFDPNEVYKCFQGTEVMVPVTVAGYSDGKVQRTEWTPFDVDWTFKGDQEDKFRDALMEFDDAIEEGTVILVKWLANSKPGKYAIKIKAGE